MIDAGRRPELGALIDEIAPAGWRRSPAWWALYAAVTMAERLGRRRTAYLASDAEPRADTLMGVPGPAAADDAAGRIGWAIAAAHALVRAVIARDGTLPEQPLTVTIALERGAARTVPVASPWRVGFAVADRVVLAHLDPRGPAFEDALARRLAAAVRHVGPAGPALDDRAAFADAPGPLAVIALGDDDLARAHHGHRRGWRTTGGPWLGLARAGGLTALSTCHMVVDGWGHALLAADVARGIDRAAVRHLAATAAASLGDAPRPPLAPLPFGAGEPLGVAWRRVASPLPGFAGQAWALGRVLHADHGDPGAPRSPTFQVPVAPGAPDDPTRFARRVRPAVLSVRFSDGVPEPLGDFAARARAAIAREAGGDGLIARLLAALAALPLPLGFKRRSVVGARAAWLREPVEVLAGAGCLSLLRPPEPPPLVAVSSPAQLLPAGDARATSVLTVIGDHDGATVTLAGSGRATDPAAAEALLDGWLSLVASIPLITSARAAR